MTEQKQGPPHGEWNEEVLQKLDGGLRRLLRMTDEEIVKAVEQHEARLTEKMKRIEQFGKTLPRKATDEDRQAVQRLKRLYRAQLEPHPVFGALIIDKVKPKPIKIRAIVHFTGSRDDLAALGLEVRAQAHDIFTVTGTKAQLADLAAQPATLRLRLPRLLLPTVENATAQAEVSAVHQPRPPANPMGFQGDGVIVGIIDGELDVTHHGFLDPAAPHDTRVLYYWVQTPDDPGQAGPGGQGQTPHEFHAANSTTTPNFTGLNYGRIYTAAYIDNALGLPGSPYGNGANHISCQPEPAEHGTHVAGIATGSGHMLNWATAPQHIGAAPRATIVHVRYWRAGASLDAAFEDSIIEAIDFIFRAATFHNMPVVINVSQGTSLGPHNGADVFDQDRDNRLNSFFDRAIVWAAGNDNNDNGFRKGTIAAGVTETLTLTPTFSSDPWGAEVPVDRWLDIWYTGPELDFQVECDGNLSTGNPTVWHTAGNEFHGTLNSYDVDADRDVESGNGLCNIRLHIEDALSTDPWTIRLHNPDPSAAVQYYAWTGPQGKHASLNGAIQHEFTLCDPGCCKSILTVGACAKLNPANPGADEPITGYSGCGPTVDGRIKPEIVAVGGTDPDQVNSANSNQASGYTDKYGTSMAAPLVAGAVALLFDEYHTLGQNLNQDTIKALLTQTANRLGLHLDPTQPGYVERERNQYGYGRLRLIAPIDHSAPLVDVDVWVRTAADDYGEEPYLGGCFCGAPDIRVCERGTDNEVTELTWGTTYDVKVTVRNLGADDAEDTAVRLKYTRPWVAPNDWHEAAPEQTVDVPALGVVDPPLIFEWRPEAAEIGAAPDETHFCLLVEVDHHDLDNLVYPAPSDGDGSAWATNIKGTNNVALRNVHIQ